MKSLIDLYNLIESENIILEETWSNNEGLNGIYINIPNINPIIGINKSLINNTKELRCTLSEELGHHFTTCKNLITKSEDLTLKHKEEIKAKTWGVNFLVSDDEFAQAILQCISNRSEMCAHFGITNELLQCKINSIIEDEKRYSNRLNKIKMNETAYYSCNI